MAFSSISIVGQTGVIYYIVLLFSIYRYAAAYRRGRNNDLFISDIEYYWGMLLSPSFSLIAAYWIMNDYGPFYRIHVGYLLVFITSGLIIWDAIIRKRIRGSLGYSLEAFFYAFIMFAALYLLDMYFSVYQWFDCDKRCANIADIFGAPNNINIITFMSYVWISFSVIICTIRITSQGSGHHE